MDPLVVVAGLAAMPALAVIVALGVAESIEMSAFRHGIALHLAAGGVVAVFAFEIIPTAISSQPGLWVVGWLLLGGLAFLALDWGTDLVRERSGASARGSAAWVIFLGLGVDIITDGLMIGAGSLLSLDLAILLALGLVLVDGAEAFVSAATFRRKNVPPKRRRVLMVVLALLVPVAAVGSRAFLADRPSSWSLAVLTFTAGMLMTLLVEEMAPAARDTHEKSGERIMTVAFLAGFAGFATLSALIA